MGRKVVDARPKKRRYRRPYPPGVLVTGVDSLGVLGPIHHRSHLFLTGRSWREIYSNSGYVQKAICIVCDESINPCDSSFYEVKATKKDIQACRRMLKEKASRFLEAWDQLGQM